MAFLSTYTREEWNEIGGFAGVAEYVSGVELLFHEDYDEDEDTEEERTEKVYPEKGVKAITHSAMRPYRFYQRDNQDPNTWWLMEEDKRVISDTFLLGLSEQEGATR